jgi:hypothetical protein
MIATLPSSHMSTHVVIVVLNEIIYNIMGKTLNYIFLTPHELT